MSDEEEARRRILERRAQFIRAAITSAGIGSASLVLNACDNPMAQPCLEPLPIDNPPSAQPCLEPMPLPADADVVDAGSAPNPSASPSASVNTNRGSTPISGTQQSPRGSASSTAKPPPTQTVVKPPTPMPCLKPMTPPKTR